MLIVVALVVIVARWLHRSFHARARWLHRSFHARARWLLNYACQRLGKSEIDPHVNSHMFNIDNNSWLASAESYSVDDRGSTRYLTAYLHDTHERVVKNEIRLHPLLEKYALDNVNGILTYNLTKEEDDYVMDKLFPTYTGPTIPTIDIKQCVMLTVDDVRYNAVRQQTLDVLRRYNLPKITIAHGYTPTTAHKSAFFRHLNHKKPRRGRGENTCGMLDIFDRFARQSKDNEWLLFFEDDVRPVNVSIHEDLGVLHNVPIDADLIRPNIGSNTARKLADVRYKPSFGGGLTHAFYISSKGCTKVLNYAKHYGWKFVADIDLYKLSVFNQDMPTGLDGWSLSSTDGLCSAVRVGSDEEKLVVYHMDHILFNQTSNPCAPFITTEQ